MNMKNEEKIYQLNTYNIAEYTSTDYTDNDIAILGDFKNLLFNKYFKLNANIYVVCVKGRLQININTQKYAIYPGEMLICMPNMILSNCTTSSDFKGAMGSLSTQITQKYLHKSSDIWNKAFYISQNPVVRIDKDRVQLFDLYYKVIRARMKQAEQPYYKEVIRSLIRTMLYELLADLNQLSTPPESQMVKRSNILFKRFLDLLACTEVKKRSISYYAGKLCVTPKYLSTVCKKVSGKTAFEWINDYVVEDIKYFLKYSNKSIKEISEHQDFPNISFFGKYVKTHLGTSPTDYRKQSLPPRGTLQQKRRS